MYVMTIKDLLNSSLSESVLSFPLVDIAMSQSTLLHTIFFARLIPLAHFYINSAIMFLFDKLDLPQILQAFHAFSLDIALDALPNHENIRQAIFFWNINKNMGHRVYQNSELSQ